MDNDRVEGRTKEAGGTVQEKWGEVTGDEEAQAEGQEAQTEGKVQSAWGDAKDAVSDAFGGDDDKK